MKKGWYSKIVVLFNIFIVIWFTDRVLDAFVCTGGQEPIALIGSFFGFFGMEGIVFYFVKKHKLKNENEINKIKARKEPCNDE